MDYKETKGLHEVVTSGLKDGDERNFCFLSIDVVGHSKLSSIFSPESINNTLMNLRNWINPIIKDKNGTELNWGGDGGNFGK